MNLRSPANGLTLVELLIAISVMVVLAVLIIPRVRAISDDNRVHEAARLVAAQISKGSMRALSNSKAQGITLHEDAEETQQMLATCVVFHRNSNMIQDEDYFGTTTIQQGTINVEKFS